MKRTFVIALFFLLKTSFIIGQANLTIKVLNNDINYLEPICTSVEYYFGDSLGYNLLKKEPILEIKFLKCKKWRKIDNLYYSKQDVYRTKHRIDGKIQYRVWTIINNKRIFSKGNLFRSSKEILVRMKIPTINKDSFIISNSITL